MEPTEDIEGLPLLTMRCPVCQCRFFNCYSPTEAQCLGCEAFINTDTMKLL